MHRNAKRKITSLKHKLCKIEEGHISALEIGYYLCIKENKKMKGDYYDTSKSTIFESLKNK